MPKKILLVDDEPQVVLMLRSFLKDSGYEVDEAFCGADVYERISQKAYDLLVLDFLLPDMAGNEICRNICQEAAFRKVPILIITGFSYRARGTFLEEGASDVIYKPIHLDEFLSKVTQLIGK